MKEKPFVERILLPSYFGISIDRTLTYSVKLHTFKNLIWWITSLDILLCSYVFICKKILATPVTIPFTSIVAFFTVLFALSRFLNYNLTPASFLLIMHKCHGIRSKCGLILNLYLDVPLKRQSVAYKYVFYINVYVFYINVFAQVWPASPSTRCSRKERIDPLYIKVRYFH